MNLADILKPYTPADGPPPRTLGRFLAWALKGTFPIMVLAAILSGAVGTLEAFTAIILGMVIDAVVASGPADFVGENIWLLVGLIGFFVVLRPLMIALGALFNQYVLGPNVWAQTLSRVSRYTLGHAVQFFDNDFAGRIAQKEMQVANSTTEVVVETINTIAYGLVSAGASVILALSIHPLMGLAVAVWVVSYYFIVRWFLPRARIRARNRANARANVTGQIVDTITNIKTVKLFARDGMEDQATHRVVAGFRETALAWASLTVWFRMMLMIFAGMLPAVMIGGTAILWSQGLASEGQIAAAGAISIRLGQMVGWISFSLMQIYSHVGEIEDGVGTLTPPHTLVDADGAKPLVVENAQVEFDNVTFAYGRETGGVEGINLTIKPGEKLGIVGASGAGKSTLVSLLLRMYDAEGGEIRIDGQNVSQVTQASLRSAIGMVTQETAMFNRTARDNILYGRPDASMEEVEQAARRAEAMEFIGDLQDHKGREGFEAFLGERGVKLSGGQRQRIALARAILKDAPILVLDEATSALDSEVEADIQRALDAVMEGKTVLAIAHRLSTIAHMDRIVVLDQGRIAEQGTHDQLLAKGGLYANFWNRQSGGFIGMDAAE